MGYPRETNGRSMKHLDSGGVNSHGSLVLRAGVLTAVVRCTLHMMHSKPGFETPKQTIICESELNSAMIYEIFICFVCGMKLDVTVDAVAHSVLMCPWFLRKMFVIGFVNQQSSGDRSDHILWIHKKCDFRNLSIFCGSTKFGKYLCQNFMDPQNFEGMCTKILWIHKILKVNVPKFYGSIKFRR